MSENMDIIEILMQGGPVVKGVLILLIFCSLYSWAIIFRKRKEFKAVQSNNKNFLDIYNRTSSLDEVLFKADNMQFCPYKEILSGASLEIEKFIGTRANEENMKANKQILDELGEVPIKRAMDQGVNKSNLMLDSGLSQLASIGSIAPFVGLFGTVWGILNSFSGLGQGGGSIEAIAPGIAEALVATAIGLAAAIPAVYAFNHFNNQSSRLNVNMENFQQEILNRIRLITMKKD